MKILRLRIKNVSKVTELSKCRRRYETQVSVTPQPGLALYPPTPNPASSTLPPTQVWVEPRLDRTALRCSRHQAAPHLPSPQTLSTGKQAEECPRHSLGHQDFFSKPRDFKTWGPLGVLFYVFPRQRRPLLPRLLTESYVQRPTC